MKKGIARLLVTLLIMLAIMPVPAWAAQDDAAAAPYQSLEELPYVTVSRPDMTGDSVQVTMDENKISVATPSGKSDFDPVTIRRRNATFTGNEPAMKWTGGKTKAYTLKNPADQAGSLTKEQLDRCCVFMTDALKKDTKINQNLAARKLTWEYSMKTGAFIRCVYLVQLKDENDKENKKNYTLEHFADGGWRYKDANGTITLFDENGQAVPLKIPAAPDTKDQIAGLPDMNLDPITLTFPRNDASEQRIAINAQPDWDVVALYCSNGMGTVSLSLAYDESQGTYVPRNPDAISNFMQAFTMGYSVGSYGLLFETTKYMDEYNSKLVYRWESTIDQYFAYAASQDAPFEGTSTIYYDQLDARGSTLLRAIQYADHLHVTFWDISGGDNNVEKDYPVAGNTGLEAELPEA